MFFLFFISVVEAGRVYSVREATKASLLGFDDARSEYKWVQPINNRNGFLDALAPRRAVKARRS